MFPIHKRDRCAHDAPARAAESPCRPRVVRAVRRPRPDYSSPMGSRSSRRFAVAASRRPSFGCNTSALRPHVRSARSICTRGCRFLRRGSGVRRSCFAGLLPRCAPAHREQDGDVWIVDGIAPWVSGWGLTDVVHVAARSHRTTMWCGSSSMRHRRACRAEALRLLAVNASATVTLSFDDVRVDADRETSRFPWSELACSRRHGSADQRVPRPRPRRTMLSADRPVGARRGAGRTARCTRRRHGRDPARRAGCGRRVRSAGRLGARRARGERIRRRRDTTRSACSGEATLLLVFGSRPSIRRELLTQLGVSSEPT